MWANYRQVSVFSKEAEDKLVEYVIITAQMSYGLTLFELRQFTYKFAKVNHLCGPSTWKENKMAGSEWFKLFRTRHPKIGLIRPEKCSLALTTAFNQHNVCVL